MKFLVFAPNLFASSNTPNHLSLYFSREC